MKDPEFIEFRNKILIGLLIVLVFSVPIVIFLVKTYGISSIISKINKQETFTVLVTSNDCEKCKLVSNILKDNHVKFIKLNSSTNKDYEMIIQRLDIENKRSEFPIIVYVENGKMKANLFLIDNKEAVISFLEFHGLNK